MVTAAPKYKAFLLALVLSLIADQGTKIWARASLKPRAPDVIHVIPGYFELEYAENTSSAFGVMPRGEASRWILFAFGIGALGLVGFWLRKSGPGDRLNAVWLGLLAGGAVGNLYDRGVYGYVTDFILWRAGAHRWPNFNIADAALVAGIAGLFVFGRPQPKREAQPGKPARKRSA